MHNENELDDLNLPDPKVTKNIYHLDNNLCLDDDQFESLIKHGKEQYVRLPVICARQIFNIQTEITTHFVLCSGSQFFNPSNTDVRYRVRNRWKMRRVNKTIYDLYIKFLHTKHKTFLYQAERGI